MIQPEPITIDGRSGVLVFLDEDGIPVDSQSPEAVVARAVFDDGGRATYAVQPKDGRTDLGGAGSGNFGHAGRPGEVGGSGEGGKSTGGGEGKVVVVEGVRRKPDGGTIKFDAPGRPIHETVEAKVLGPDLDLAGVVEQMVVDVPGNLTASWNAIHIDAEGNMRIAENPASQNALRLSVRRDDGLSIMRTFTRHENGDLTVHHDLMEVPQHEQGKGTAKKLLADSYDLYKKMGVTEVQTLANLDAGGYAWAKFGFTAKSPPIMADQLIRRMTPTMTGRLTRRAVLTDITPQERTELLALIETHRDNPKLPWHIAGVTTASGRKIGKELLSGSSWEAVLPMDNTEATTRLEHYVAGSTAPQLSAYRRKLMAFLLGGPGSGNFGHSGRPGEVGGSGGDGGSASGVSHPLTKADEDYVKKHSAYTPAEIEAIGDKSDGGKILFGKPHGVSKPLTPEQATAVFGDRGPHDVAAQMIGHLAGDVTVHVSQGSNPHYPDSVVVDVFAVSDNFPNGRTKVARQFIRTPDGQLVVNHDSFEIPAEAQGKGIAKTVLADSMRAYRALGVDRIETTANMDRGGYAWAKFGFTANDPAKLAEALTSRVQRAGQGVQSPVLGDATPQQQADLLKVIAAHRDDPRLPWHVAGTVGADGQPLGKDLLFETDWSATLDLKDAEAMARFNHYVKGH